MLNWIIEVLFVERLLVAMGKLFILLNSDIRCLCMVDVKIVGKGETCLRAMIVVAISIRGA